MHFRGRLPAGQPRGKGGGLAWFMGRQNRARSTAVKAIVLRGPAGNQTTFAGAHEIDVILRQNRAKFNAKNMADAVATSVKNPVPWMPAAWH